MNETKLICEQWKETQEELDAIQAATSEVTDKDIKPFED